MMDLVAQLAALLGGPQGPEAAKLLDASGVPPPTKASMLGGPKPPAAPGADGFASTFGFMDPNMNDPALSAPAPAAAAAQPGGGDMNTMKLALAANQGLKAPEPIKPIMSGGVTGGVKVPEMSTQGGQSQALGMLLQALGPGAAGKDPLRVPTLGALMGGRR